MKTEAETSEQIQTVKCVVVGDAGVGKTTLLHLYTAKDSSFPLQYTPAVFDNFCHNVPTPMNVAGKPCSLGLYDTEGQEDFDRLRPLSYPRTDVFLVCFSVVNATSFQNAKEKWVPEISQYCKQAPFLLVGTKIDLRNTAEGEDNKKEDAVSFDEGAEMARELDAFTYLECSALDKPGIQRLFNEAILAAKYPSEQPVVKKCIVM